MLPTNVADTELKIHAERSSDIRVENARPEPNELHY